MNNSGGLWADRLGFCEYRKCRWCGVTEMILSTCLKGEIGRAGFWAIPSLSYCGDVTPDSLIDRRLKGL